MAQILLADDDSHIRDVVRFALEQAGHQVSEARDGMEAFALLERTRFDVAVLDVVMPAEDGLSLCRRVRAQPPPKGRMPILFLSSRDDEIDKILGLELGGDDYITKPFSVRELVSRVAVVLRRIETPASDSSAPLSYGPLSLDTARHRCTWSGTEVVMTVTEFAVLCTLVRRPGVVFSRAELVTLAYGEGYFVTERTVDSHVRRIRKKLSELRADPVETVYGVGYRIRSES